MRKIANFNFICLSDSSLLFGIRLVNVNTFSISQMNKYLGFGGLLLNTPVIKLQTFGSYPLADYLPCHGKLIRLICSY